MVVNGPITMHLGDTAEVVLAMVGGLASRSRIILMLLHIMKNNDKTAQIVFDQLFKLPSITSTGMLKLNSLIRR